MKRTEPHSGAFLVAISMFLLVGVISLASASRQPFLRVCTGPWHTYKASHMTESAHQESIECHAVETTEDLVVESKTSPRYYVPDTETLPVTLLITFPLRPFRSPPFAL